MKILRIRRVEMNINIAGKHVDIGDSLKAHIESNIEKMVEKYFGDILEVRVCLSKSNTSKDNFNFHTDLSFHVGHNLIVQTKSEEVDPYRSFDLALEKMDSRIKRYKSRLRIKKRHDSVDRGSMAALSYVINSEAEDMGESDNPVIIAEMGIEIPKVSVSDAVMQMDLTDQPIMMFRNASSGNFNVVYRRTDGHIGWIDPSNIN